MIAASKDCASEQIIAAIAKAKGLQECKIRQNEDGTFSMCIKVQGQRRLIYLSTRRNTTEARTFAKISTAVDLAKDLFNVRQITIELLKSKT